MVKHIILWQLKDELSAEEKVEVKKGIKESNCQKNREKISCYCRISCKGGYNRQIPGQ